MLEMPSTVKVGVHTYLVGRRTKRELSGCTGECDFDSLTIFIRKGIRRTKAQETLLHEVLHACADPSSLKKEAQVEEDFVNILSPHLLQVMQDNPDLMAYLTSKL
jgi:hypothetical protein